MLQLSGKLLSTPLFVIIGYHAHELWLDERTLALTLVTDMADLFDEPNSPESVLYSLVLAGTNVVLKLRLYLDLEGALDWSVGANIQVLLHPPRLLEQSRGVFLDLIDPLFQ